MPSLVYYSTVHCKSKCVKTTQIFETQSNTCVTKIKYQRFKTTHKCVETIHFGSHVSLGLKNISCYTLDLRLVVFGHRSIIIEIFCIDCFDNFAILITCQNLVNNR